METTSLTIQGRLYAVERKDANLGLEPYYVLTGARGATYFTMRNQRDASLMFLVRENWTRGRSLAGGLDGVWLTDRDGNLRVSG